jgi:hypothetical protein
VDGWIDCESSVGWTESTSWLVPGNQTDTINRTTKSLVGWVVKELETVAPVRISEFGTNPNMRRDRLARMRRTDTPHYRSKEEVILIWYLFERPSYLYTFRRHKSIPCLIQCHVKQYSLQLVENPDMKWRYGNESTNREAGPDSRSVERNQPDFTHFP